MARKKDLCRNSSGLFVRNLGWKQTPAGYTQHKFYLGRDEPKAKVASVRLEQLWLQVCAQWQRLYGDDRDRRDGMPAAQVEVLRSGSIPGEGRTTSFVPGSPAGPSPLSEDLGAGHLTVVIRGVLEPPPDGPDRPVWDSVTLSIAQAICDGASVAAVPPPTDPAQGSPLAPSVADWLDALRQDFPTINIEIADPKVHREA